MGLPVEIDLSQEDAHVRRVAVLFLVLGLTAGPPSAFAESSPPGGERPITLVPTTGSGGSLTGAVTPMATPGVSYACANAGTLRRRANSYVLGWCTAGMHIDISSTVITQGWQGGYGEGDYQNCGWFLLANGLNQGGTFDHNCGNTTFAESYFASAINSDGDSTGDGTTVSILRSDCHIWLNVRPWSNNTTGYTTYNTLSPATDEFRWRYSSKYGYWVLGHWLRNGQDTTYNWGFVKSDCVSTPAATRGPTSTVPAP